MDLKRPPQGGSSCFTRREKLNSATRFHKFKIQLHRSGGSTPWKRIINITEENLVFFHDQGVVIRDINV